uniref:Zinc-ribbon domain-containing protein n=1 Tax=Streptomyces sp. NBC_01393 TaxID=2903851 RepID=A0AAU3I911_9ACTN
MARLLHSDNPHRTTEALRLAKTADLNDEDIQLLTNTPWQKWIHAPYWLARLRQTVPHAGHLVAVSDHDQDLAARLLHLRHQIPVIANGVDTHAFRPQHQDDDQCLAHLRQWLVTDPRGGGPGGTPGSIRYTEYDLARFRTPDGRLRPILLRVGRSLDFKRVPVLLRAFAAARARLDPAPVLLPMGPDHRWCTTVANRARNGYGCPFCLNQRVSVTNSLATLFPQIAGELAPDLNGGRTAHHYVATSSTTATWRCAFGHSWTVPVVARTRAAANGGGGCPDCYPTRASLRQLALASALAHALPNLMVDSRPAPVRGLDGRTREPDITIPALRLALEYDGSFYHRGRDTHDAAKSQALRTVGWQVVRLRETELAPTHDHDLVVPILPAAQADTLVPELLTHLLTFLDAPSHAVLAAEIGAARIVERPTWQWTSPPPRFEERLQALRVFAGREGHGRPVGTHWEGDCALGGWVMEQRRLYRAGKLPPCRSSSSKRYPGGCGTGARFAGRCSPTPWIRLSPEPVMPAPRTDTLRTGTRSGSKSLPSVPTISRERSRLPGSGNSKRAQGGSGGRSGPNKPPSRSTCSPSDNICASARRSPTPCPEVERPALPR